MKPIEILQGKWLGHPLHPAIVHLAVGGWIAAAILDVIARDAAPGAALPQVSLYCVILGLAGALLAVPTGVADWTSIKKEKPAWKLGLYHMVLNLLAAVTWAANLGLRFQAREGPDPVTAPIIVTSLIGALLVLISGYIGSRMVFDHGVGVARESKQKWRKIAQQGGARLPDANSGG